MAGRKRSSPRQGDIRAPAANLKRKNIVLDQEKVDAAREILGAESDVTAIDEALSPVIYGHRVLVPWPGKSTSTSSGSPPGHGGNSHWRDYIEYGACALRDRAHRS